VGDKDALFLDPASQPVEHFPGRGVPQGDTNLIQQPVGGFFDLLERFLTQKTKQVGS
jgi:hypothetical protein